MALRMSWHSFSADKGDLVTVYWFSGEPKWQTGYTGPSLGMNNVSRDYVDATGTPDEFADWTAAATACVDEVVAAAAELRQVYLRTWRWRRRPVVRRWADAKYTEAKESYLERVRAAVSAYQPVRDVVERRVAERTAVRLEEEKRAEQEQQRQWREDRARFQVWVRRQAVADRRLPGGLTPRRMAARSDEPASWPPEVVAAVGDLDVWWAGVRASVRNEQARAEAVREVIEVITSTAAALEEAGRPGISAIRKEPPEAIHGWQVDFTWSDLPGTTRLRTPPDVPVSHLGEGAWDYDLYLPDRALFTPTWSGTYRFATVRSEGVANNLFTRHAWTEESIKEFTKGLFPTRITYHVWGYPDAAVRTRITDHADPAAFVPYVHAVAQHVVACFQALVPGRK